MTAPSSSAFPLLFLSSISSFFLFHHSSFCFLCLLIPSSLSLQSLILLHFFYLSLPFRCPTIFFPLLFFLSFHLHSPPAPLFLFVIMLFLFNCLPLLFCPLLSPSLFSSLIFCLLFSKLVHFLHSFSALLPLPFPP